LNVFTKVKILTIPEETVWALRSQESHLTAWVKRYGLKATGRADLSFSSQSIQRDRRRKNDIFTSQFVIRSETGSVPFMLKQSKKPENSGFFYYVIFGNNQKKNRIALKKTK